MRVIKKLYCNLDIKYKAIKKDKTKKTKKKLKYKKVKKWVKITKEDKKYGKRIFV